MKTGKEVKTIVDSRLSGTDYERCSNKLFYNDKRKTCRRFKMFVKRVDKRDCTQTDITNVEMILEGETGFKRLSDYIWFGDSQFKYMTAMCFVWKIAYD